MRLATPRGRGPSSSPGLLEGGGAVGVGLPELAFGVGGDRRLRAGVAVAGEQVDVRGVDDDQLLDGADAEVGGVDVRPGGAAVGGQFDDRIERCVVARAGSGSGAVTDLRVGHAHQRRRGGRGGGAGARRGGGGGRGRGSRGGRVRRRTGRRRRGGRAACRRNGRESEGGLDRTH
ncbi:hypothetical protein B7R54_10865 [Subtercola boreus]|uniref:Uncharacterized protein n=1 Tax=Subtercola boreus TaxID=120213 RepID=A0A3E0VI82_9MICO|nr:hypothetical protein B7R54_10865 [Subtercola boreus]